MHKTTIILADDHSILREGLKRVLESVPDLSVVGEAGNGIEALGLVEKLHPDIIILDISMPEMNGIEVSKLIHAKNPNSRILILTIHDDEGYVTQLMKAGVDGYILKNSSPEIIIEAVRTVATGERYLGEGISRTIVESFIKHAREVDETSDDRTRHLTKREIEILRCIAGGLTGKEIANKLFLSIRTVQSHRMNIMQKLNIHETAGLVMYAVKHGFVGTN